MNYFALIYNVVDDYITRRAAYREEHLKLAKASVQRGELRLAGALGDPIDRALLIFYARDKSIAEDFVRNDPYVQNGLVTKWEVQPWKVVIGNDFKGV